MTNETIADIIAEMRGMGNYQRYSGDHARVLAGRLEAAHKRERGDAAKLREALRECAQYIACVGGIGVGEVTINDNTHLIPEELTQKAITALAAPTRNCDIGSAEEQWRRFCDIEAPTCRAEDVCHCRTAARCFADWSQRPYEEGGAK